MHFIKTIAAAFALTMGSSSSPLAALNSIFLICQCHRRTINVTEEKNQTKLTNISDALDDLLTNVQGGLRGGLDFLSIPSGDSETKKTKREGIPGAAGRFPL
jgi:hypothetical protein